MTIWFTSDQHFGHKKMVEHRLLSSVEEMDELLIANWNSKIQEKDTVYILGDISFHRPTVTDSILKRLNGSQKFMIIGNHDKDLAPVRTHCAWVKDLYTAKIADPDAQTGYQRIVLCHYAMRTWDKSHYGAWHLYGHSHGSLPEYPDYLSLDVGVDANALFPISYEDIKTRMSKKSFKPVDHHTVSCP